jgi:hypothetical protein
MTSSAMMMIAATTMAMMSPVDMKMSSLPTLWVEP